PPPHTPPSRHTSRLQLPCELALRPAPRVEQPMHLAPAVLPNHASLPEWCDLGASVGRGRRRARQQCLRHDDALLREEGGEFSMTTGGDYWVTADRCAFGMWAGSVVCWPRTGLRAWAAMRWPRWKISTVV